MNQSKITIPVSGLSRQLRSGQIRERAGNAPSLRRGQVRELDAQMSSIPSDMPSDREQELRRYVQANYGDPAISDTASTLPYYG